jgi:hypothetical protein
LSNGVPSSALASLQSAISARVPTIDQTRRAPRQYPETQLRTHYLRDRVLRRPQTQRLRLIRFNHAEATSNTSIIKYPMNRVLRGLLGEKKFSGDFRTGHPAFNQWEQPLHSSSRLHLSVRAAARSHRTPRREIIDEHPGVLERTNSLSLRHRSNCGRHLYRRRFAMNVTQDAEPNSVANCDRFRIKGAGSQRTRRIGLR